MKAKVTEQDYELLSQYLDGELADGQARELRERLLSRAGPARRVRAHESGGRASEKCLQLGRCRRGARHHQADGGEGGATRENAGGKRLGWGLGVAASVLFAAGVVMNADPGRTDRGCTVCSPGCPGNARSWRAHLPVGRVGRSLPDGSQVRALLSFPSVDGGWCREYLLAQEGSEWRGVACREASGQWVTAVLAAEEHTARGRLSPGGRCHDRPGGLLYRQPRRGYPSQQ